MVNPIPGLEGITVARMIFTRLSQDPELQDLLGGPTSTPKRIVEGVYPGTEKVWITWTIVPDFQDVKGVGAVHIFTRVQFQMKVVAQANGYGPALPVYQRAHALLESITVPVEPSQGGAVLTCHRVSGVQYPEKTGGIEYRHIGGLYEAITQ